MILGFIVAASLAQAAANAQVHAFSQKIKSDADLIAKHHPFPDSLAYFEKDEKHPKHTGKEKDGREDTDNPWAAVLWLRQTLMDNARQIPSYGLKLAYSQREANIAYQNLQKQQSFGIHPFTSGPSGTPWVSVGPTNIGGRTRSLVVMPNQTTLIAGSVSGGIWRSTDSGASWNPVNDQMPNLNIGCIVADPNNSNHLLAGTGEAFFNVDANAGDGIWQSTDGGLTWSQLQTSANIGNVAKIAFCPTNSNDVLAATVYNGIWQSTDGGNSWTNVYNAQGAMDVKFSPWDSTRAVADILNYNGGWTHQAFYSTDSGHTWNACSGIPVFNDFNARMSFDFSHTTSNNVWCVSGNNGGQVWYSSDDGQTFQSISQTNLFAQTWYNNFILVNETDDSYVYIPNGPLGSADHGKTFSPIAQGYIMTSDPHPDVHLGVENFGFNGTTNNKVYFTTDGGIFDTNNISTAAPASGWNSLNQSYVTTQFYSAEGDKSGIYFGGLQDNGTVLTTPSSSNASLVFGGDGGFVNIDHTNPNYLFGEYVYGEVFAAHDGLHGGSIYNGITDADPNNPNANFISPIMLDPNNPTTLLVGGDSLWRTTDADDANYSPPWSIIRNAGSNLVSAISIANGDSTDIWIGQNDGVISHTADGTDTTPSWTDSHVSAGNGNITRYVQHITIDPNNHNRVFVAFGGLVTDNLYESTDGGSTWTDVSGSGLTALPAAPIRYMTIHPYDSNWLFAGTAVGLYESMDGGATWSAVSDGPSNVDTWDTRFIPGTSTILLGTHGRGMWKQNEVAVKQVSLGANTVTAGTPVSGTVYVYGVGDANGPAVALQSSNTSAATVPASVTLGSNSSSVGFTVTTLQVASNTNVTITATIGSTSQTANLTVNAETGTISSFYTNPSSITGGTSTHGVVQVATAAGSSGESVQLSSPSSTVQVPSSATIPSGSRGVSFSITTSPVSTSSNVQLTAKLGSSSRSTTITLTPYPLSNFYTNPSTLNGGLSSHGVVQLTGKAGSSGDVVSLQSASSSVTLPSSVTVPAGTTGVSFMFSTSGVATQTTVTLTASLGSSSKQTSITLNPATISNFYASPSTVTGGTGTRGVVQTSGEAPSGGAAITLQSDSTSVTVPTSATIPQNGTGVSFAISTSAVSTNQNATLTATYGSSSSQATVTLTPYPMSSFYVSPTSVKGGTATHGVVQLSGKAGPAGNVVSLQSSDSHATVPASVTVPAGTTGVSFAITTKSVTASTNVTITATFNGQSKPATLTLTP